ncbi:4-aminobutyrate--2-oxoglutarate transaminase [Pseudactinotalea suaedae]|uniref:4-aminobutyrate--2-oxoglutarate transaminase n=1 Tax=Pseudactinotalea suaedae TaxID=1524924 RepID=UPI0012E10E71|nr:4-aminobutyrate--2-oxoglutarate transaminase [Pseudactinotalea suaedae]
MRSTVSPNRIATHEQARRLLTELPGPRSRALAARRAAAVASGVASVMPVFAAEASGGVVVDVDGNSLIDLGAGIAVTTIGNADPEIVSAVTAQAERFTHTCFTVAPYEGYVEVAEALNRVTPGSHSKRTALFSSGAEAVENAVKVARAATGRSAVVVFDHAFHGRTTLTMSMTAKEMPYKHGFGPFAPEIYRVPGSYPYRDGLSAAQALDRTIEAIRRQVDIGDVAAVVVEPIQGEGGFIVPAVGYLSGLADWCAEHGVLLVADEIQTGFARTGDAFACDAEGVVPDLLTTAKGIAGGLPLSAVTGREEVMNATVEGGLGGTYAGNPLSCAAALVTIDRLTSASMLERARAIEATVRPMLERAAATDARIGDIRGRGAMLAVEIVDGEGDPDAAAAKEIAARMHRQGVITLTCGSDGNVIRLLPPLTIPTDLLVEGVEVLIDALAQVA